MVYLLTATLGTTVFALRHLPLLAIIVAIVWILCFILMWGMFAV